MKSFIRLKVDFHEWKMYTKLHKPTIKGPFNDNLIHLNGKKLILAVERFSSLSDFNFLKKN